MWGDIFSRKTLWYSQVCLHSWLVFYFTLCVVFPWMYVMVDEHSLAAFNNIIYKSMTGHLCRAFPMSNRVWHNLLCIFPGLQTYWIRLCFICVCKSRVIFSFNVQVRGDLWTPVLVWLRSQLGAAFDGNEVSQHRFSFLGYVWCMVFLRRLWILLVQRRILQTKSIPGPQTSQLANAIHIYLYIYIDVYIFISIYLYLSTYLYIFQECNSLFIGVFFLVSRSGF